MELFLLSSSYALELNEFIPVILLFVNLNGIGEAYEPEFSDSSTFILTFLGGLSIFTAGE